MKDSNQRRVLVAGVALCLAVAATSTFAQFGGGMGGGGMHRGGGSDRSSRKDASSGEAKGPSVADRLYQLRTRLLVTPEQSPAWERMYAAFMALQQPARRTVSMSEGGSALQTMQETLSQAQDRYTLTETLADSMKQLYAQLSADQRTAADDLLPALITDTARARSVATR
jgi:hypothetical protein